MPKRILIIEDDPDILEILNIIFKEEGYEVFLSDDGREVSAINEIKPDLILLDIRLKNSGQNGTSICARLKSDSETKKLPVILVSTEANLSALSKECGADAYIHKPFDIAYLSSKVFALIT